MESRPQNPEFRINPENFHPWIFEHTKLMIKVIDKKIITILLSKLWVIWTLYSNKDF